MPAAPHSLRQDRHAVGSSIALGLAAAWCIALLVGAATLPAYSGEYVSAEGVRSTSATLVEENGAWVLAVVALPLIPVLLVAAALWRRRQSDQPGAGPVAWTAVGVLGAFAFITGFSIGLFVLPVVGLLALACATASGAPSANAASSGREACVEIERRSWVPYVSLATLWFVITAFIPGPAVFLAFGTAAIGLIAGFVRYHHDPAAQLPAIVFVGISVLAGSALLLLASRVAA